MITTKKNNYYLLYFQTKNSNMTQKMRTLQALVHLQEAQSKRPKAQYTRPRAQNKPPGAQNKRPEAQNKCPEALDKRLVTQGKFSPHQDRREE